MKDLLRGMEKIMKTNGRMINIFIFLGFCVYSLL